LDPIGFERPPTDAYATMPMAMKDDPADPRPRQAALGFHLSNHGFLPASRCTRGLV